jgi:hypothetical protein
MQSTSLEHSKYFTRTLAQIISLEQADKLIH